MMLAGPVGRGLDCSREAHAGRNLVEPPQVHHADVQAGPKLF